MRIRPGAADDLDALQALEAAAFAPEERASRRAFRHAARSPTVSLLVLDEDGTVRGYAISERRRGSGVARLTSIAIDPDRTGSGLGRRLLAAMEEDARRHGCTRLRLEVRAESPARRLYESAGYRRVAVVPDYYEAGADAGRYEKPLAPEASSSKRSTSRRRSTKARAP